MRCPVCKAKNIKNKDSKTGRKRVQKFGKYYRKSDSKMIQRYKCFKLAHINVDKINYLLVI